MKVKQLREVDQIKTADHHGNDTNSTRTVAAASSNNTSNPHQQQHEVVRSAGGRANAQYKARTGGRGVVDTKKNYPVAAHRPFHLLGL
jgi:hypothetical protein